MTLTETFALWQAERRAWRMACGHGESNKALARNYEVRMVALGTLCNQLMCGL